jgi:hypothetical protein
MMLKRRFKMSEKFEFEVAYSTTFEQIEQLRAKMLAFVKAEKRDFQPSFDVVVVGASRRSGHSFHAAGSHLSPLRFPWTRKDASLCGH